MKKVGFARSTWRKAKEFQEGIEALSHEIPLGVVRAYLASGEQLSQITDTLRLQIDKLQSLRKSGISGEMQYVKAQVKLNSQRYPLMFEEALAALDLSDEDGVLRRAASAGELTAEALLGDAVVSGEDIRLGFPQTVYELAPSLQVYKYFMWMSQHELSEE